LKKKSVIDEKRAMTQSSQSFTKLMNKKRMENMTPELKTKILQLKEEHDNIEDYNSEKKKAIALDHLLTCEFEKMNDLTAIVEYPDIGLSELEL